MTHGRAPLSRSSSWPCESSRPSELLALGLRLVPSRSCGLLGLVASPCAPSGPCEPSGLVCLQGLVRVLGARLVGLATPVPWSGRATPGRASRTHAARRRDERRTAGGRPSARGAGPTRRSDRSRLPSPAPFASSFGPATVRGALGEAAASPALLWPSAPSGASAAGEASLDDSPGRPRRRQTAAAGTRPGLRSRLARRPPIVCADTSRPSRLRAGPAACASGALDELDRGSDALEEDEPAHRVLLESQTRRQRKAGHGDHVGSRPAPQDACGRPQHAGEPAHAGGRGGLRGAAEDRRRRKSLRRRRLRQDHGEAERSRGPRLHRLAARPAVRGVTAQTLALVAGEAEADRACGGLLGLPARTCPAVARPARRTRGGTPRARGRAARRPPPRSSRRRPRAGRRSVPARRAGEAPHVAAARGIPAPPRSGGWRRSTAVDAGPRAGCRVAAPSPRRRRPVSRRAATQASYAHRYVSACRSEARSSRMTRRNAAESASTVAATAASSSWSRRRAKP